LISKCCWPETIKHAINTGRDIFDVRPTGYVTFLRFSAYQYPVMDQRLSVLDHLMQGIRVIDLKVAAMAGIKYVCADQPSMMPGMTKCSESCCCASDEVEQVEEVNIHTSTLLASNSHLAVMLQDAF
jgi:hypothetical protein